MWIYKIHGGLYSFHWHLCMKQILFILESKCYNYVNNCCTSTFCWILAFNETGTDNRGRYSTECDVTEWWWVEKFWRKIFEKFSKKIFEGKIFAWIKKEITYISGQRDDRSIGANDVGERVYLFIQ